MKNHLVKAWRENNTTDTASIIVELDLRYEVLPPLLISIYVTTGLVLSSSVHSKQLHLFYCIAFNSST